MNLHRFPHGTISSVWCGVVRDIGDDWLSILGSISGWHYMLVVVSKRNSDDFFLFLLIHAYMFLKPKC